MQAVTYCVRVVWALYGQRPGGLHNPIGKLAGKDRDPFYRPWRPRPPIKHSMEFATLAEAVEFRNALIEKHGSDSVATTIVPLS